MAKSCHHRKSPSPAVRDCPAVAEIAEFARRAPHLNLAAAHARAVTEALRQSCERPEPTLARPLPTLHTRR